MRRQFYIYFFLFLLVLVTVPRAFAATEAEASVGNERITVGEYDVTGLSASEKEWFITFLKGNIFSDGWEQVSSDILMSTNAHEREEQKVRLDELGYKIGREWCKGNNIRRIHTSMLIKWGRELKDTADEAPQQLSDVIQRIDTEIDELLN